MGVHKFSLPRTGNPHIDVAAEALEAICNNDDPKVVGPIFLAAVSACSRLGLFQRERMPGLVGAAMDIVTKVAEQVTKGTSGTAPEAKNFIVAVS